MSISSSTALTGHVQFSTPSVIVSDIAAAWKTSQSRKPVRMSAPIAELAEPLKVQSRPAWPGMGEVCTSADVVPLVVIPGMPPSMYTAALVPLAAHAIAELLATHPHLATMRDNSNLVSACVVSVAVRAGVWAAIGAAPHAEEGIASRALRWSVRKSCIMVRPADDDHATNLWRYFLATMPALPPSTGKVMTALAGMGPLFLLLGANIHCSSGEMFAHHVIEQTMSNKLLVTLSREARTTFSLKDRGAWDTMAAAAITGLRVSVIKHLSEDRAFCLGANMILAPADKAEMSARIDRLVTQSDEGGRGVMIGKASPIMLHLARSDAADSVSIADTEADLESRMAADFPEITPPGSGTATPRPEPTTAPPALSQADADAIRAVPLHVMDNMSMNSSMMRQLLLDDPM